MSYRVSVAVLFCLLWTGICRAYDNVLIFTIDTLRADHLGCYGSKDVKTPNIDGLAAQGVVFRNTVSAAPFTLPSHVSIMTGLIPPIHGVHDNGGFYLDKKVTTLAEKLKAEGMNTAAFVGAFPLDSRFGLNQGFDLYDDHYPTMDNISDIRMPERPGEEITALALKWLQSQQNKRWFAWIHYYDPHFPYKPPEPYKKDYAERPYAGEIAYVDEQVGKVLNFLRDSGLQKRTLVVLTADHGESLGEHQEKTHGIYAYQGTMQVPLIIAPARPAVVSERVRLVDVAPTVLDLLGTSFTGKIQGHSLKHRMEKNPDHAPDDDSYFEALTMYLNAGWAPLRGFYSGEFKFIDLPIPELYNVQADPQENKNLCSDEELCNRWKSKFASYYALYERPVKVTSPIDAETAEQLRALGYVSGTTVPVRQKQTFGPADDPKSLISYLNRVDVALNWYSKGYDLKALEILEKIIDEKPDYSVAYMHAAFIYSTGGFPEKAVDTMKLAIKAGMTDAEVMGKLGVYLFESGKFDEAIRNLRIALKEDPNDLDNLNYLGMSLTAAGNYAEAETIFRQALALDTSDGKTLSNLGTLYLTQKKTALAITQFQAAIAANPRIAGAYNGLGVIYAGEKNWPEAIRNWTRAVEENASNYDALLNLAYAYMQQNDRAKALELFQQFVKNAPEVRYGADIARARAVIRQLQ